MDRLESHKNESGIYEIRNIVNDKLYIGQTTQRFMDRLSWHKSKLRKNKHWNDHLQRSWNKYGEDNFEFNILIICDKRDTDFYEKKFIKKFETHNPEKGYNNSFGGDGSYRHTERTKKDLSKKQSGKNNPMYGGLSDKHTENISKATSGKNNPMYGQGHKLEGKNNGMYGVERDDEVVEAIREAQTNENNGMYGEDHPGSKLSKDEVIEIKELLNETDMYYKDIAENYDVGRKTIGSIARNEIWSHIEVDAGE